MYILYICICIDKSAGGRLVQVLAHARRQADALNHHPAQGAWRQDGHHLCWDCGFSAHGRFRGGLVFEAKRLWYHSTPGSRVIKKDVWCRCWHTPADKLMRSSIIRRKGPGVRTGIFPACSSPPPDDEETGLTLNPQPQTPNSQPYTLDP